jgi:nucleotide-binding universal stress UspA family protein
MEEFRKILFPIDFSKACSKLVPWVNTIAKQFEAEVHMLFVARSFQYLNRMYVDKAFIKNFENESLRGAKTEIQEFARMHFDGYLRWKAKVILGDPAEDILNYIKAEGIDLVIIATHSRKGLDRILFGSVAERVVKSSSVPVLSINPYKLPAQ